MSQLLKIFPSLLTLAYGAWQFPPDLQKFVDRIHDTCIELTGVSEVEHAAYDIINNPHDEKLQCYILCVFKEANWMDDDGVINYDWLAENIHESVRADVIRALDQCHEVEEGDNLCEKASNLNACVYKADNGEHWYLV